MPADFSWASGAVNEQLGKCHCYHLQHLVILPSYLAKPRNNCASYDDQPARWRLLVRPIAGISRSSLPQRSLLLIRPPLPLIRRRTRSPAGRPLWPPDGPSSGWRVLGLGDVLVEWYHPRLCWSADEPLEVPGLWHRKTEHDM